MSAPGPRADALVVVDLQLGWVTGDSAVADADRLVEALESAASAARSAGALVVHVQDVGAEDPTVPMGSTGRDLALHVHPGDAVVRKLSGDAFEGTALEEILRDAAVETLAVGGLMSEMCVSEAVRSALRRGFEVVLPRDAHSTYDIRADGAAPAVSAAEVRRVAEWSLGDELVVVDAIADVAFRRPARGAFPPMLQSR
ncbi:isochorismatase family protein [Nocardioides sp. GCM10027113]|uniref:isochorismatase family protein n=1 Tax=unclassified Nocardioides TaxID=2615069 RepID=UPI0036201527